MTKKPSNKLILSRETLRNLDEDKLRQVQGGATNASCANSCDPISARICPTSRRFC